MSECETYGARTHERDQLGKVDEADGQDGEESPHAEERLGCFARCAPVGRSPLALPTIVVYDEDGFGLIGTLPASRISGCHLCGGQG